MRRLIHLNVCRDRGRKMGPTHAKENTVTAFLSNNVGPLAMRGRNARGRMTARIAILLALGAVVAGAAAWTMLRLYVAWVTLD